jgi:hypothetical protein
MRKGEAMLTAEGWRSLTSHCTCPPRDVGTSRRRERYEVTETTFEESFLHFLCAIFFEPKKEQRCYCGSGCLLVVVVLLVGFKLSLECGNLIIKLKYLMR